MNLPIAQIKDAILPLLAVGGLGVGGYLLYKHQQAAASDTQVLPELAYDINNPSAGWFGGGWGGFFSGGGSNNPPPQPPPSRHPGPPGGHGGPDPAPPGYPLPPAPVPIGGPPGGGEGHGPLHSLQITPGGGSHQMQSAQDYAFDRVLMENTLNLGLAAHGR